MEAGQGREVGQNHGVIATRSLSTMLVQLFEDPLMLSQLFNRHCSCPSAFTGVISYRIWACASAASTYYERFAPALTPPAAACSTSEAPWAQTPCRGGTLPERL
jgi:hypothetical protein